LIFYVNAYSYENERKLRVAVIHGMARMAALMASTYKAYLGVGLGPLEVGTEISYKYIRG
jgi:zeaxanthin epoxidase